MCALHALRRDDAQVDADDGRELHAQRDDAAVDLAAEEIDFSSCRILVTCFENNGDVEVYSVPDSAAEAVKAALKGDGILSGTVAAEDMERAFSEAVEVEEGEHEEKRASVPPPAMPAAEKVPA